MLDLWDRVGEFDGAGFDPLKTIEEGLAGLAAEDRASWPVAAKSEQVTQLLALQERLNGEVLRLIGEWDRDRAWELDGSLSPAAWLTLRTTLPVRDARRLVTTARIVDRHPEIAERLADGRVTASHVNTMARVVTREREPLLAEHAVTLVEAAQTLGPDDFAQVMRRWAALADDQLDKDPFASKWQRRSFHVSETLDGWAALGGLLDPVGRHTVITALDHLEPPDPTDMPDGPRSLSQRRADALVALAHHYLRGGTLSGNPPHLNVVVDLPAITGDPAEQLTARMELDGVGTITRQALHQLACDGALSRVLMAGDSEILDMGRTERFATPAQRRAVAIRDRHCQFPSCRRLPPWCDVHHILGWFTDDGPTDLNNLILLCRRHHTLVENTHWTITKTTTGTYHFHHPARGP